MSCQICGGSGVLNVQSSHDLELWTPVASPCHACETGTTWLEAGL